MSAIAGMFGPQSRADTVRNMLGQIAHRGADNQQVIQGGQFALGAGSLKLGPTRAPALAGDEKQATVYDGLLCNDRGMYPSDAEWLASRADPGNEEWLQPLDGSFALATANDDNILLVRDHVGARPLFFGKSGDTLVFASEIKALQGLVPQVEELKPGTALSPAGAIKFATFDPGIEPPTDPQSACELLRRLLRAAVAKRMEGTGVRGIALSGGLDSSIIAALGQELVPDLHFFTVGLEGSEDVKHARIMAEYLGAADRHHVHTLTEKEIEAAVPRAVRQLESFDEDCISGTLANMFASRLAADFTTSTLCGEGADELFGGYHLLKEIDGDQRQQMMDKLVAIAYNTALRRLDRGWLSSSVFYLAPFLDTSFVDASRKIPHEWKIDAETQVEKHILREAFRDILPAAIADRRKLRFAAGSSVDDIMDRIAERHVSAADFERNRQTAAGYRLNTPKEYWYYRIFKEIFPEEGFETQVARWDPFK